MPLDNPDKQGVRCCREHTEALVEAQELGVLWDKYGIVGNVVVSYFYFSSSANPRGRLYKVRDKLVVRHVALEPCKVDAEEL
jgi:hypothetical protein